MKTSKIFEMIKILETYDLDEIEYSKWNSKIRLVKGKSGHPLQEFNPSTVRNFQKPKQSTYVDYTPPFESQSAVTEEINEKGIEVKSPIVGTFYSAPATGAEPYVKVGDMIKVGQPLCIIEAMKIMNVIEAEVSGKIEKILVENGKPVEYNQTLFVIEKS
ncbi:MAG: acetyl-CoA carboxylase, biotin carboxyl carrier protein [Candidatus Marinimicrobia bacterium CG08_land_8_20_14_0_20_45_22]|nr:MAG: acetyl-CoA carboxylase, biotin carboxyl carrier protein [Candidatus Marinimicrobia bacterium CG08_land_8_20_14_0_20_45_22]